MPTAGKRKKTTSPKTRVIIPKKIKEEPETGEVKAGEQRKKKISTIVKKNNKKRSTD